MFIEEALAQELSSVSGLKGKVYPLEANENVELPYVVYQNTGNARIMIHSGFDGLLDGSYQLDIYHSSYSNLKTLTALVIAQVKTFYRTTIGGVFVQHIEIIEQFETYDPDTKEYQCSLEIQISYCE